MNNRAIKKVQTSIYAVPLAEVLSDAKHGAHTHFELIIASVELEFDYQKLAPHRVDA